MRVPVLIICNIIGEQISIHITFTHLHDSTQNQQHIAVIATSYFAFLGRTPSGFGQVIDAASMEEHDELMSLYKYH